VQIPPVLLVVSEITADSEDSITRISVALKAPSRPEGGIPGVVFPYPAATCLIGLFISSVSLNPLRGGIVVVESNSRIAMSTYDEVTSGVYSGCGVSAVVENDSPPIITVTDDMVAEEEGNKQCAAVRIIIGEL
jgi:hypothetical protein